MVTAEAFSRQREFPCGPEPRHIGVQRERDAVIAWGERGEIRESVGGESSEVLPGLGLGLELEPGEGQGEGRSQVSG